MRLDPDGRQIFSLIEVCNPTKACLWQVDASFAAPDVTGVASEY